MSILTERLTKTLTVEDEAGIIGWDQFDQLTHARKTDSGDGTFYVTSTPCIADVREMTCPICGKGWELTTKSFVDQVPINLP